MESKQSSLLMFLVVILTVPLTAVTVSSALCPTNKIAPHRRISRSWNVYNGRTLGSFYDLLAPGPGGPNPGYYPSLQEEPQRDDPDDCGDIDDYDEHDLSALIPNYQRRDQYGYGDRESRLFFGLLNRPQTQTPAPGYPPQGNPQYPQQPQYPPNRPQYPPNRPQYPPNGPQYPPNRPQYPPNGLQYPQTQQPQRPIRPPYSSGGYFENNPYRPPIQHYPSDDIKPVHDGIQEPQTTYRPHVVGGPSGHVIGVSPVSVQFPQPRPTRRPQYPVTRTPENDYQAQQASRTPAYDSYPQPTTQQPYSFPTRPSRPRQLNNNNGSILGSFLDLLFK